MRNILFLLCFALPFMAGAQSNNEPYKRDWEKADSLLNRGFPESAKKILDGVYAQAKAKNQQVAMLKAQLFLMKGDFQKNEDAAKDAILKAEQETKSTGFPVSAVWQSITAQLYWNYYINNRWKILDRTATNTTGNDFEQWDAAKFFDKIASLYKASLSRAGELKQVNIAEYDPVLVKGVNTRNLRPTLFDLLAFRAIGFYQNDEKDVTRPTFQFVMDDAAAFSEVSEFAKHNFKTEDTGSMQWQALKLYQQILSLHQNDIKPDALIDADLQRLDFAFAHSVHADKKELYRKGLERIENKYASNPLSAMASYKIAMQLYETRDNNNNDKQPKRRPRGQELKYDYAAQKKKLDAIVSKFPDSEGGIAARQMLQQILAKQLTLQSEDVVLPGEASKILLNYKNVEQAYFKVVPVNPEQYKRAMRHYYDTAWYNTLMKGNVLQKWQTSLPGIADYDAHTTEIKIDALPIGMYALVASSEASFARKDNILTAVVFQVSMLSVISSSGSSNDNPGFVLNRKTGRPIANARIEFYTEKYNNKTHEYDIIRVKELKSGADGSFKGNAGKYEYYQGLSVKTDNDALYHFNSFNLYGRQGERNKPSTNTFLFTDRSIYRPGQTIYFKGIMVSLEDGGKKNTVIANKETEVTFYDANGQKISSLKLKSNEFGSFTGKFTAPESGLTGNMHIGNSTGSVYLSVEEYKRPKFAVKFDDLKGSYALNDEIKMTGKAEAYAGNNIDGATVKYRVTRNIVFPYYWLYYRWYGGHSFAETEITNGTTTTDKDGKFTVNFTAKPDLSVDKSTLPTFIYTVHADVTDINGETRSSSQRISAGYIGIQITASLPEKASPKELDTINVRTQNLNGQFEPAQVTMKISLLKGPDNILRKRQWAMPDQFVMDEATFRKFFPNDEYKDEASHLNWAKGNTVLERSFTTTENGKAGIDRKIWNKNGWYVIELETKDKSGTVVSEKKYVQVWDAGNSGHIPDALALMPQSQTKEPGEKAVVNVLSGYKELFLIQQEQTMNNGQSRKQLEYSHPLEWSRQVTENDRGGITVGYVTIKENRVYQVTGQVYVPWSNKDLKISWETHRDKLQPGQKETWTMVVSGPKKEKVAAEMVGGLYDASLDAYRPHGWSMHGMYPSIYNRLYWQTNVGFGTESGRQLAYYEQESLPYYEKSYDVIFFLPEYGNYYRGGGDVIKSMTVANQSAPSPRRRGEEAANGIALAEVATGGAVEKKAKDRVACEDASEEEQSAAEPGAANENTADVPLRKNLQETAFFYPQLRTDANGNIRIEFTMPEALTEWKFMALAHTQDMSFGQLSGTVKTQKDLMVMPGLPRFFRQGDEMVISTKISNLSDKDLKGPATLSFVNALTNQPLDLPFRLKDANTNFSAAKGESAVATWKVNIPETLYEPVLVRIVAKAGDFSDGEENAIPVVSNRMMVTETLPLWIHGNGTKNFSFEKLRHSDSSETLSQYRLTVEYTDNPAWYAVQALPYLMDYPYECAEQTFNRFYANALAAHIIEQSPKIEQIFRKWENESTEALLSNLEKNQELKSALLEETPWVMEAKNETEQKKRIAMLFETHKLARSLDASMRKLKQMQMAEGAFPWFHGMYPDRYITQYILTGMGRLKHLGVQDSKGRMNDIVDKALPYLDRKVKEDYDYLVAHKINLEDQHIDYFHIQYLYMRSFYGQPVDKANQTAVNYYKKQAAKYWPKFNAYMKGMIAIALHRNKDTKEPKDIINSLKETAMQKDELGMHWMNPGYSYWWYDAPIEAQSLLIECFAEVAKDTTDIDKMKVWLLKQKQTQNWRTTKATADACYALLLNGSEWLNNEPVATIQLGNETIKSTEQKQQAGTGYFKTVYDGVNIQPVMGDIKLTVADNDHSTSWGAVYWQYFENMDKISSAATPLTVKKQLYIERNTNSGPELQEITEGNSLAVGDKVKARIEIIVDRDMEYVHLKDMRAACFEPVNVISSYKYQGGLGYYESTKDVSTNFFFGRLPKGKYVFEYPMFVTNKGDFSNGIATIQCMYAPEFSSHSEGVRVKVK
ncbi:MAG TPA: alpha-2-macroglobulin family protein [Flavipsychrobacter sp.]|nr:alpha-2-macroglobulin family protein [Flavipsychrobacter sp.]